MRHFCLVMPFHISENRGGGAEVQAWMLAKELSRRGFKVDYLCQTINPEKIGLNQEIEGVTVTWLKISGRFLWLDSRKYYVALRHIAPDVVVQRLSSCVTWEIAKYCKRHNKQFVWVCTDDASPKRWTHIRRQSALYYGNNASLLKKCVFWMNALVNDLFRDAGMGDVDITFTQNEYQYTQLLQNFNLSSGRMISGHPSPSLESKSKERMSQLLVLWVANLGYRKDPQHFISLARNCRDTEFRFVMVGGHPDQSRVASLFADKPDNLIWTDRLPFSETLKWFDKATAFVNTSNSDGEGFPNTFVQAWMRGVPVITLGVDPNSVITENHLGYVCSNVEQAAFTLRKLLNDYDKYRTVSRNAEIYARENHSIKLAVDNFLSNLQV